MIDVSNFPDVEAAKRALALPLSEVIRHASVSVDNSGIPANGDTSFTAACFFVLRASAERLKIAEPKIRFYVRAKRWYDGTNTYHSVRILDSDMEELAYLPMEYGYGDHWMTTAFDWFKKNGFVPADVNAGASIYFRETLRADADVIDVKRKRDL